MSLTEKTAYIKGLADGLDYDKTTKEGKIIEALLDLVGEMAAEIADIQEDISEIDEDDIEAAAQKAANQVEAAAEAATEYVNSLF